MPGGRTEGKEEAENKQREDLRISLLFMQEHFLRKTIKLKLQGWEQMQF